MLLPGWATGAGKSPDERPARQLIGRPYLIVTEQPVRIGKAVTHAGKDVREPGELIHPLYGEARVVQSGWGDRPVPVTDRNGSSNHPAYLARQICQASDDNHRPSGPPLVPRPRRDLTCRVHASRITRPTR